MTVSEVLALLRMLEAIAGLITRCLETGSAITPDDIRAAFERADAADAAWAAANEGGD